MADGEAGLPPLIPRKVIFGNPQRDAPRISPDGRHLAYLSPSRGVLNVWVRNLGQEDDRVVTSDPKRGIRNYFWQGDSAHILYLQDMDGDENFHLYQTNISTCVTRDLTPIRGVRAIPVAVDPNRPGSALLGLNAKDPRLFDVFEIDLHTGERALVAKNPGDVTDWTADHDFRVRVSQVITPDGGAEIRSLDESGQWRLLQKWGPDDSMGGVAGFAPGNGSLYLLSSLGANSIRLQEADARTGAAITLYEDPLYDVSGLMLHPKTHALQAVGVLRARLEWHALDPAILQHLEALRQVRDADFNVQSRSVDDARWIASCEVDNGPTSYYLYETATKSATLLFTNRPDLEQYRLAHMQPVSFPARDGLTLHGYLTTPVGMPPERLPAVLLVHGGPWARDTWGYDNWAQWLANRGYAVLQVNFRGSAGYGKEFLNAGNREWGAKMHTDLLDAKEWIVQSGVADSRRVAIIGGSYGGYATLAALAFTPDEFACGVDIVGPSNLVTLLNTIPPYWAPMIAMFCSRVGNPATDLEFLASRSPLHRAAQIKAPLFIAQGANDPRVKQTESDQIVQAMRKNGLPVEYLVFPDEGHGFARPENNLIFAAAAEAFLGKHLGGRVEPPAPDEDASPFMQ